MKPAGETRGSGREAVERAVQDFQRGHEREKSFEVLFHRYRPRLERFLAHRVFSPDERLDLTQEILLRIYQGLNGYRGEGSLDGWVLQIAFNAYRKWRDRQPGGRHARPEVLFDPAQAPEPMPGAQPTALTGTPSAAASPLDRMVRQQGEQALREAIEKLPRQQRLCLALRLYQERSMKEIAVALRISPETVKVHLFQARHRLLEILQGTFEAIEF
jgi:RNA polymerase sigma-70 factor (ECF subfamily)